MSVDLASIAVRAAEHTGLTANGLATVVGECATAEYQSRFASWDRTASVRRRPRRELGAAQPDTVYFPPELVPTYDHPLVSARSEVVQRRLLVHALYSYLQFTTDLEDIAVIPVAMSLSRGRSGLLLPEQARQDAYNIVTDEAWHAQFSHDLYQQIRARTGEPVPASQEPMFVERLRAVSEALRTDIPGIGDLLFAVVSETLISVLLAKIPHDARLPAAVRETVADHAADEGRHHAYFRDILTFLWQALAPAERTTVGPWLPSIIMAFIEPDYRAIASGLVALGLGADEVEAVLTESYPRTSVLAAAAATASSTIRYFAEVGALDEPATADAFAIFDTTKWS